MPEPHESRQPAQASTLAFQDRQALLHDARLIETMAITDLHGHLPQLQNLPFTLPGTAGMLLAARDYGQYGQRTPLFFGIVGLWVAAELRAATETTETPRPPVSVTCQQFVAVLQHLNPSVSPAAGELRAGSVGVTLTGGPARFWTTSADPSPESLLSAYHTWGEECAQRDAALEQQLRVLEGLTERRPRLKTRFNRLRLGSSAFGPDVPHAAQVVYDRHSAPDGHDATTGEERATLDVQAAITDLRQVIGRQKKRRLDCRLAAQSLTRETVTKPRKRPTQNFPPGQAPAHLRLLPVPAFTDWPVPSKSDLRRLQHLTELRHSDVSQDAHWTSADLKAAGLLGTWDDETLKDAVWTRLERLTRKSTGHLKTWVALRAVLALLAAPTITGPVPAWQSASADTALARLAAWREINQAVRATGHHLRAGTGLRLDWNAGTGRAPDAWIRCQDQGLQLWHDDLLAVWEGATLEARFHSQAAAAQVGKTGRVGPRPEEGFYARVLITGTAEENPWQDVENERGQSHDWHGLRHQRWPLHAHQYWDDSNLDRLFLLTGSATPTHEAFARTLQGQARRHRHEARVAWQATRTLRAIDLIQAERR